MVRRVYIIPLSGSQENAQLSAERSRVGNIFSATRQKIVITRSTEAGEMYHVVMTGIAKFADLDDTAKEAMRIETSSTAPLKVPTQASDDDSTRAASTAFVHDVVDANGVGLKSVTVALTASQIRNATTTPIDIVAAQGANMVIVPVSAVIVYSYTAPAFTGSNAFLRHDTSGQTIYLFGINFATGSSQVGGIIPVNASNNMLANKALQFIKSDSVGGGGSAIIYLRYVVISVA